MGLLLVLLVLPLSTGRRRQIEFLEGGGVGVGDVGVEGVCWRARHGRGVEPGGGAGIIGIGTGFDVLEHGQSQVVVAAEEWTAALPRAGRQGRVREVPVHLARVHEVRGLLVLGILAVVVVAGGAGVGVGVGDRVPWLASSVDAAGASLRELDQLAEDDEFQLQLDAVDDTFQDRLDDVQVRELDAQQGDVHGYDDDVDREQLVHVLPRVVLQRRPQKADGHIDVQSRQDRFLYTNTQPSVWINWGRRKKKRILFLQKPNHLDLLVDIVASDKLLKMDVSIAPKSQDGGGKVQDDGVDDDHPLRPT